MPNSVCFANVLLYCYKSRAPGTLCTIVVAVINILHCCILILRTKTVSHVFDSGEPQTAVTPDTLLTEDTGRELSSHKPCVDNYFIILSTY